VLLLAACHPANTRDRSGGAIELNATLGGQSQRFGQTPRRLPLGSPHGPFEILHGALADFGSLGKGSLSKPRVQSIPADQVTERDRLLGIRH
jgi:hypothetical protein